jgi:preprotein translocase subunit SecD
LLAISILLAATSSAAEDVFAVCRIQKKESPDTVAMVLKSKSGDAANDQTFFVSKEKVLDDRDVVSAQMIERNDTFSVNLKLTENSKEKFAKLTKETIGKRLAILLNGKLYFAPVVRAEITGGELEIGNFPFTNKAEAKELIAAFGKTSDEEQR